MPAPDAPPHRPWQQRWPDKDGWDNHGGHVSAKALAAHEAAKASESESAEHGGFEKAKESEFQASTSGTHADNWKHETGAGKTDATVNEVGGAGKLTGADALAAKNGAGHAVSSKTQGGATVITYKTGTFTEKYGQGTNHEYTWVPNPGTAPAVEAKEAGGAGKLTGADAYAAASDAGKEISVKSTPTTGGGALTNIKYKSGTYSVKTDAAGNSTYTWTPNGVAPAATGEAKVVDSKLAADLAKAQAGLAKAQAEGKTTMPYWAAKVKAAQMAIGGEAQAAKGPPISFTEKKGINAQYDAAKAAYEKNPTPANADALAKMGAASLEANAKWAAQEKAGAKGSSYLGDLGVSGSYSSSSYNSFSGATSTGRELTKQEKAAIQSYQDGGYHSMNGGLRQPQPGTNNGITEQVKTLDAAIASRDGIEEQMFVYRGMSFSSPAKQAQFLSQMVPGQVFTDKGFFSTAKTKGGAFGGKVKMKVGLPAGTKGMDMNKVNPHNAYSHEQEFSLRNSGFKVMKVDKSGSSTTIFLEYIGTKK